MSTKSQENPTTTPRFPAPSAANGPAPDVDQTGNPRASALIVQIGAQGDEEFSASEAYVQSVARTFMGQVEELQDQLAEELRTEGAVEEMPTRKGENRFELAVIIGPRTVCSLPQVESASKALLQELGFGDVDVSIIAPTIEPSPMGGLPTIPSEFQDAIHDALEAQNIYDLAPLASAPDLSQLEGFLLRDLMPVDGPRDEVFIDRDNGTFYLSSTIISPAGPAFSGTHWYGPFSLSE